MRLRSSVFVFVALHLLVTAVVAAAVAWRFGQNWRAVAAHILLIALWDVAVLTIARVIGGYRILMTITCTLQVYLYALNLVSNLSWGRNITGHLVVAFFPTVWSGKEPFPIAATGITIFAIGTLAIVASIVAVTVRGVRLKADRVGPAKAGRHVLMVFAIALFSVTLYSAVQGRDALFWKQEMLATFFRPTGFAFEPTARRHAVAERDAVLRASYHPGAAGRRRNVVLIIVDSLRADRMQVYGYSRPTTPFLSAMVESGRMKKVEAAFSSCSESLCGITSTLASREFRDISARTFQLQDALREVGYQTWFLLSGNHRAWEGLPQFYRATDDTFFDGSQTRRYSVDDDRVVLEGLERVPPAPAAHPAFFYVHLMSPHYLGVQLPQSHMFTSADDAVAPGLEPYKILQKLNKPNRYDDKVRQADDIIRQLFDALSAKHYLDDAMVVITGDHGEGLGERHWAHGWDLYNEDIRIPMLFYETSNAGYPDLSFAAQVDIAPTILDRLGLPIPASWEGQSLLAPTRTRFTFHQTYFIPNRFAVVYRNDRALFKFIATPQYAKEELYDLRSDPGERRNLVNEERATAELLREKVRAYRGDE